MKQMYKKGNHVIFANQETGETISQYEFPITENYEGYEYVDNHYDFKKECYKRLEEICGYNDIVRNVPQHQYYRDNSIDIILPENIIIPAKSEIKIASNCFVRLSNQQLAMIVERSSCKAGLIIKKCIIDSNYLDQFYICVYNSTDQDITYEKGQCFCSVIILNSAYSNYNKANIRSNKKFGSSTK